MKCEQLVALGLELPEVTLYEGWPTVLARLSVLRAAEAKERLEVARRSKACENRAGAR